MQGWPRPTLVCAQATAAVCECGTRTPTHTPLASLSLAVGQPRASHNLCVCAALMRVALASAAGPGGLPKQRTTCKVELGRGLGPTTRYTSCSQRGCPRPGGALQMDWRTRERGIHERATTPTRRGWYRGRAAGWGSLRCRGGLLRIAVLLQLSIGVLSEHAAKKEHADIFIFELLDKDGYWRNSGAVLWPETPEPDELVQVGCCSAVGQGSPVQSGRSGVPVSVLRG
jgi:hypothetical protein